MDGSDHDAAGTRTWHGRAKKEKKDAGMEEADDVADAGVKTAGVDAAVTETTDDDEGAAVAAAAGMRIQDPLETTVQTDEEAWRTRTVHMAVSLHRGKPSASGFVLRRHRQGLPLRACWQIDGRSVLA